IATYVVDTGSANAYAVALVPAVGSYVAGQFITFLAVNANTGASTLAVNGLATKAITKGGNTALTQGNIAANQIVDVVYDGTEFQLLNPVANVPTTGALGIYGNGSDGALIFDGSTTVLGLVPSS